MSVEPEEQRFESREDRLRISVWSVWLWAPSSHRYDSHRALRSQPSESPARYTSRSSLPSHSSPEHWPNFLAPYSQIALNGLPPACVSRRAGQRRALAPGWWGPGCPVEAASCWFSTLASGPGSMTVHCTGIPRLPPVPWAGVQHEREGVGERMSENQEARAGAVPPLTRPVSPARAPALPCGASVSEAVEGACPTFSPLSLLPSGL